MPVHAELTLEGETELMQEIVANGSANGPEVGPKTMKLQQKNQHHPLQR